jgi:hypothetical protein
MVQDKSLLRSRTFWFSLIMTGNLFIAAVVAILIVMVNKIATMLEGVKDL